MSASGMKSMLLQAWQTWRPAMSQGGVPIARRDRVAEAMLGFGVFWTIAGVLLTPTMKFYYTMVALFVYLPALWLVIARRAELGRLIAERREMWLFLALFAWANLSLLWAVGDFDRLSRVKQSSLFVLLVCGWLLWARASEPRLRGTLVLLGVLNSLYSLAALLWAPAYAPERLNGFGGFLDNPNAAAYATGFLLVMALPLRPTRRGWWLAWLLLQLPPLVYVALCGSRGALLALMATAVFCLVLLPGWRKRLAALSALVGGIALFCLEPSLMARGDSERLELLRSALPILREHFWNGVGYGTTYEVQGWAGGYHGSAHNFLLHTALQYGIPALLVWLVLWAMLGLRAWRSRHTQLGLALLLLWVYASVAMQFDVFSLWERTRAMWLMPWAVFLLGLSLKRPAGQAGGELNRR